MTKIKNKIKDFFKNNQLLSITDFRNMLIISFIFTILVFFRLGNLYAPNTAYTTNPSDRDIIIDFGDYITVEKLHVFLGNLDNRKLSLSAYNEVTKMWEIINTDVNVSSVFQWNDVDVYYKLRYLGIVATDEEAVFNEFVFTGPNNTVITPVNIDQYYGLFDEQDKFYSTTSHTYMDGTMFDEIYYARTGYEFIHALPTYETTHPQLGKCLIALSMLIFGNNPFGWRFIIALFGTLFVPLVYSFSKALFKDTFVSSILSILITFECMHYTLARICTIDTIVAFFIILSYYYMYRYMEENRIYHLSTSFETDSFPPKNVYILLLLCAIAMSASIATKLTGVYAAVGLAFIFIAHTIKYFPKKQTVNLLLFCISAFIILPIVMYTLCYIPTVEKYAQMGSTDRSISFNENGLSIGYGYTGLIARTLRNTFYMINYHRNLVATHPFQSPAQSWPIIYRTLLAANDLVDVKISGNEYEYIRSSVNYIGNPLIWWPAIPCILFTFFCAIKERDKNAIFLSIAYLAQYLPWLLVNRCIFIYHYYPAMLFSILMIGFCINKLVHHFPKTKNYIKAYAVLCIIVFFIFYPVISGLPVNEKWGNALEIFKTWALM